MKNKKIYKKRLNTFCLFLSFCLIIGLITPNKAIAANDNNENIHVILSSIGVFTIDGKVAAEEGSLITLVVSNPSGQAIHFDEKRVGSDGAYKFILTMDFSQDMGGIYTFTIGGTDIKDIISATAYFPDSEEIENAIAAVNAANTAEKMMDAFVNHYKGLMLMEDDYDNFAQWKDVYERMSRKRTYKDTDQIRNTLYESIAISTLNNASSSREMEEVLQNYNHIFNLELGEGSLYVTLETDERVWLHNKLIENQPYEELEEISKRFYSEIIIPSVNKAQWSMLEEILKEYAEVLDLNFSGDYAKLSKQDKDELYHQLAVIDFNSAKEIKDTFYEIIEELLNADKDRGNGGSAGRGGSSSGKARTVTVGGGSSVAPSKPTPIPQEELPQSQDKRFKDLETVSWAVEAIESLAEKGIVDGVSENQFKPNDRVTREQFIKMLIVAFELVDETAVCDFKDVSEKDWHYKYLASAQKVGIAKGTDDGNFGVGEEITRQDMVTLAYRVIEYSNLSLEEKNEEINFVDEQEIDTYALESVKTMQKAGVISGMENNRFAPKDSSTRAQAAQVIYGLLEHIK